jgi:hypothetical protein
VKPSGGEDIALGDVLADIEAAATRATGLSRDELLAKAGELEPSQPGYVQPSWRTIARGRLRRAGVPELHIEHVIDQDPIDCEALSATRELARDPALGFLVLSGGVGTRKTGSACWLLSREEGGLFVEADELLAIALEDKTRYLRLKRAKLVVLDDLGTEVRDEKGYWMRTFNSLFNTWYASKAKVAVTCNVSPAAFKKPAGEGGYGARVADRIRERGRFYVIGGESCRPEMGRAARGENHAQSQTT